MKQKALMTFLTMLISCVCWAQLCPNIKHPHMIDLGLPSGTKWACCNVGSSKPENYGGYFAWGETQKKRIYNWKTYKYGESRQKCQNIGSCISGTNYDVAHVLWGKGWQMPTMEQFEELVAHTRHTFTTRNGVKGGLFTASNGNSIFIPAGGSYVGSTLYGDKIYVKIWSSTLCERIFSPGYDYCGAHEQRWQELLSIDNIRDTYSYRCDGLNVRPVYKSSSSSSSSYTFEFSSYRFMDENFNERAVVSISRSGQIEGTFGSSRFKFKCTSIEYSDALFFSSISFCNPESEEKLTMNSNGSFIYDPGLGLISTSENESAKNMFGTIMKEVKNKTFMPSVRTYAK